MRHRACLSRIARLEREVFRDEYYAESNFVQTFRNPYAKITNITED